MAKNRTLARGKNLYLPVAEGTVSGSPVASGQIPGVALFDRDGNLSSEVQRDGTFRCSVKGENGSGNSAVAVGDILYIAEGKLTKIATGVRWGYALEAITSGSTKTIECAVGY